MSRLNSTVAAIPGQASANAIQGFFMASSIIVKSQAMAENGIELHVDLDVDAAREQNLVDTFHRIFEPAIGRQPGFVSVTLLRTGTAVTYRLVIGFQTEDQRVAWVATDDHQRVWPQMEANLKGQKFKAVLWHRV